MFHTEKNLVQKVELDFTRELCDIVCEQDFNIRHYYADYGGEDLFYYVNIYFPTFVPDDDLVQSTVSKISIYGDSNPLCMAPIATSEELGRLSLAQSLQLLVSDYTNLWTVAAQGAYGQAELEYTIDITFQSTLWSTILTLPNTLATTGLTGVFAQIATIPIAVASEVYEEIYVDAMIEAFIEGQFDVLGWDAKAGQILSMIITSVREAIMGPGSDFLSNLDLNSDGNLDNQLQDHKVHSKILGDIDARIEMNQEILNQITPALSIQLDTMIGVAMSIMGVLMGGDLGVGLNALMPTLIEKFGDVETYANAITAMKSLTPQQRRNKAELVQYTEMIKEMRAAYAEASIKAQLDINYNLGYIAKSFETTYGYDPLVMSSQNLKVQVQTQMESYERDLAISNLYKQFSDQQSKLGAIESLQTPNSEEDINTEMFSVTNEVAEALEGDPVWVDENGIVHWVMPIKRFHPQTGEVYYSWREFSGSRVTEGYPVKVSNKINIDSFFELLGLEEGQVVSYSDFYIVKKDSVYELHAPSGVTSLSGDRLLSDLFDQIGYVRSQESVMRQYHGVEQSLKIMRDPSIDLTNIDHIINIEESLGKTLSIQQDQALDTLFEYAGGIVHNNIDATLELLKAKNSEIFAIKLKANVKYFVDKFHSDDLMIAKRDFREIWKTLGKREGLDSIQLSYIDVAARATFDSEVLNAYKHTNREYAIKQIEKAMYLSILQQLITEIDPNSGGEIHKLSLSERDTIMSLMIQEFDNMIASKDIFGKFKGIYSKAVLACNFHISTIYTRDSRTGEIMLRDNPIFFIQRRFDTGVELESVSSIQLLALEHISTIKELSKNGNNNLDTYFKFIQSVSRYSSIFVDNILAGDLVYLRSKDSSAFDVLGLHWTFDRSTGMYSATSLPSKNSQIGNPNSNYISSLIGRDVHRVIGQIPFEILEQKFLNLENINLEIILNGPMFDENKAGLNKVDLFNTAVLKDLVTQSYPDLLTNGLSGYRYLHKTRTTTLEFSQKRTYWHKFSSSQNIRKALFESINDIIDTQNSYDSSIFNVDGFKSLISTMSSNIDLVKEIKRTLGTKFGYFLSIEEVTNFMETLQDKITDYYAAIYDSNGDRKFGLDFRGVIATYFETQEDLNQEGFDEDDTTVIAFKIEVKNGQKIPVHDVKKLVKNEDYLRLSLSEDEIKEGWRIGVCLVDSNGKFTFHEQAHIALNGKKVIGRFYYNFETGIVLDRGKDWYLDKNKWTYYKNANDDKIGIQLLNILSISHAGETTFVYTRPKITSQYLKHNILYGWAETFFPDGSWVIERSSSILDDGILIQGIHEAQDILTTEEYYNAYFALLDFKNFVTEVGISSRRNRNPQPILNALLGKMNVKHNLLTGQLIEDARREKSDVQAILNSVFSSEEEIMSFLFKKIVGEDLTEVVEQDFLDVNGNKIATLKQWIDFVASKITSGDRVTSKNPEIEKLLQWASSELEKIPHLDLNTEEKRRIFATDGENSELERGMKMLNIIIYVIGHTTFRDILTHCIAFKGSTGSITIDILDAPNQESLSEYCKQFSFYPPQFSSEKVGEGYISPPMVQKYKYSLYFGDSVVYLPVEGNIRDKTLNAISLGYVPTSFLSSGTRLSQSNIDSVLLSAFQTEYELFMGSKYGIRGKQSLEHIRSKIFLNSGYEGFKLIEPLLLETLGKIYSGSEYEHYKDFGELILRNELLSQRAAPHATRKTSLRGQLEDVIIGLKSDLIFHKMNDLSIDIRTIIEKNDFKNIHIFSEFSDITTVIKDTLNEIVIKNRMATLEEIIRDNGGRTRIFTTVDIMGKGIQYTKITETTPAKSYLPKLGINVRSHIDIDLKDSNSQDLLRKIVKLTLSYVPAVGRAPFRKFGFVVVSLSTGKPVCLLNGDRFLKLGEIHSLDYKVTSHDIHYEYIDISKFSGIFDIEMKNKEWQQHNTYFPYDLSKESLDLF